MKSTEFIIEDAELDEAWLNSVGKKKTGGEMNQYRNGSQWYPAQHPDFEILIKKLPGGNFLYRKKDWSQMIYHIWNQKSLRSTISVKGYFNPKSRNLSHLELSSLNINTVPAHIFYATIIKLENISLEAKDQSIGAKKVWEKLAKMPGINVHGWLNGEPVNVTPHPDNEDEIYRDGDIYSNNYNADDLEVGQMTLIAHKA